jgi:hypothetical protein
LGALFEWDTFLIGGRRKPTRGEAKASQTFSPTVTKKKLIEARELRNLFATVSISDNPEFLRFYKMRFESLLIVSPRPWGGRDPTTSR